MAITSYDNIIAAHSAGEIKQPTQFVSSSGFSTMCLHPALPTTTNLTGVLCDANTEDIAPWFKLPGAGDTLLLGNCVTAAAAPALLCDLLWYGVQNSGGTTWQSGTTITFNQPPLTRHTSGDGVFAIVYVVGASGMLNASFIVRVTDNLGNTGQLPWGSMRAISYYGEGATDTSLWTAAPVLPPPYGAGGVRKIESIDFMTTVAVSNTFTVCVGLVKPLCLLHGNNGYGTVGSTFSEMCSNILRLTRGVDNSQPCLVSIGAANLLSSPTRSFDLVGA